MVKAEKRVPVTERAIIQRINRKFATEKGKASRQLKKSKGSIKEHIGDFYILDPTAGGITTRFVDVEKLARQLGVLADWEYFQEKGEN
jgi:hypothetical protein